MPITSTIDGSHASATITGRFDAHETPEFRTFIDDFIAGSPGTSLDVRVLLSGTTFIDSSGLAELVRAMKLLSRTGGGIVLVDPSDPVMVILELTRLATTFEIEVADAARESV